MGSHQLGSGASPNSPDNHHLTKFIAIDFSVMTQTDTYLQKFRGSFTSMLRWPQLDKLWDTLRQKADAGWYAYAIGETPPTEAISAGQLDVFLREIDVLLRKEHDEDYCGIVYADDTQSPTFVKIYDPNNLGLVKIHPCQAGP